MTEEAPQRFDVRRLWLFLHNFYLCFVHLYPSLGDNMTENKSFFHHEMTLLLVEHKMNLSTSFKNFLKICQAIIKASTMHREIIHEYLYNLFYEI